MSSVNDELVRLLSTQTPISIYDRGRRAIGVAGPATALAPLQQQLPSRPLLGWLLIDRQLDPDGEVEDAFSPVELSWLLMRRFRRDILLATLAHHRYQLMFPTGASLAWPGRPLDDWRPPDASQHAQWLADPSQMPLSTPRVSPPRPMHSDLPESQRDTLAFHWA